MMMTHIAPVNRTYPAFELQPAVVTDVAAVNQGTLITLMLGGGRGERQRERERKRDREDFLCQATKMKLQQYKC